VKARIERTPGTRVALVKSSGGVFEIEREGHLVFSKKASGRFPSDTEVEALAGA
jgi:selT/selW/selH-like putative selenoprotein